MTDIRLLPSPNYTYIKLEVTSTQDCPVIVWFTEPGGRLLRVFHWPLRVGLNVTAMRGIPVIDPGKYQLIISDKVNEKVYKTHFIK